MQFGKYSFTPVPTVNDRPVNNKQTGLILLEVKETGELHVIVAAPLPLTLRSVFSGKVGRVLSGRFGKQPMPYLNVYYWASGNYCSTKADKEVLSTLIVDRLVDQEVRDRIIRQEKDCVQRNSESGMCSC